MKRSNKNLVLGFAAMLAVFPFFTNCSEPLSSIDSVALSSLGSDSAIATDSKTSAVNERALLSAEQVLKSMSSVTGVALDNDLTSEYQRQQDVLSGSFNLDTVTSPMLLGITNLAGRFCSKLVAREAQQGDLTMRKFFKSITFSTRPESLTAANYNAAITELAKAFWGREPTADELASFAQARTDFLANRDMARAVTTNTNSLMAYVCTGMLSSFDSFTF